MPRFISLLRFTEQGAKAIGKSTSRARDFVKSAQEKGVQIEGVYWTVGHHDGVLIVNAPDQTKALRCIAELIAQGNVRTDTMPAFIDTEFENIVS